jgi:hypothetical protein
MARVAEFLPPERIVQVGIRALAREEAEADSPVGHPHLLCREAPARAVRRALV